MELPVRKTKTPDSPLDFAMISFGKGIFILHCCLLFSLFFYSVALLVCAIRKITFGAVPDILE